jgi:2-succinyl-6-hydroxy-2,4-cyclohexadiene-1-carboxylate synthase
MWMLLHGFTGSPRSWDAVVACASFPEPPLTPTLFGHGADWRALSVVCFADEVARLCEAASTMTPPRFLAGYSLGARVAAGMLTTAPELFAGALLVGMHPGLTDEIDKRRRREVDAARAGALRSDGLAAFVDVWEREPIFESQRRLPTELVEMQRALRLEHDAEGLARSLEVLGLAEMPSYGTGLGDTAIPVTLMVGSDDAKFRALASDLEGQSGTIDTLVVEGAGHNLLLEASAAVASGFRYVERRVGEGPHE